VCFIYHIFTDIQLFAGKGQDISRMDHIVYQTNGFDVVIPILQQKTIVAWAELKLFYMTIKPYNDSFGERYTFILKSPPVSQLDPGASWYNRLFGISRGRLKLYIDDERIANFHSLKEAIDQNLHILTRYEDAKRGKLIKETEHIEGDTRTITQQWEPKRTEYGLQLIYDAYNRDITDVLVQHGMLHR
jgi:hypothetical protein